MSDLDRLLRSLDDLTEYGLRPDEGAVEALLLCAPELIAVAQQVFEPMPHGTLAECRLCGRRWIPGAQVEHHWTDCPVGDLRAKLREVIS